MKSVPIKLVIMITIIYAILHCTLFSAYTLPKPQTPTSFYISLFQWIIPALFGFYYVLFPKTLAKIHVNIALTTWSLLAGVVLFTVFNLTGMAGLWFSWSTLALIFLLLLVFVTLNQGMSSIDVIISSVFAVLLAMGLFEVIYQIGVLKFYDFFGVDHRNFGFTMIKLLCWIEPAVIILISMQKKYKMLHFNKYALGCGVICVITGTIWYVTGFAIPVIWHGTIPSASNANEILIAVSRGTQVSLSLGIVLLFGGKNA